MEGKAVQVSGKISDDLDDAIDNQNNASCQNRILGHNIRENQTEKSGDIKDHRNKNVSVSGYFQLLRSNHLLVMMNFVSIQYSIRESLKIDRWGENIQESDKGGRFA